MKQTAVEWLFEQVHNYDWEHLVDETKNDILEQAKAMEKEQIIESYCQGCWDISHDVNLFPRENSEQYYNETYGK